MAIKEKKKRISFIIAALLIMVLCVLAGIAVHKVRMAVDPAEAGMSATSGEADAGDAAAGPPTVEPIPASEDTASKEGAADDQASGESGSDDDDDDDDDDHAESSGDGDDEIPIEVHLLLDNDRVLDEDQVLTDEVKKLFKLEDECRVINVSYIETPDKAFLNEGWVNRLRKKEDKKKYERTYKKRYPVASRDASGIRDAIKQAEDDGLITSGESPETNEKDETFETEIDWSYDSMTLSVSYEISEKLPDVTSLDDFDDARAADYMAEGMPEIENDWNGQSGWGTSRLMDAQMVRPMRMLRFTGELSDQDIEEITIEIWPVPGRDGQAGAYITELSFKDDDYADAAAKRTALMEFLDDKQLMLHKDALKTSTVINAYFDGATPHSGDAVTDGDGDAGVASATEQPSDEAAADSRDGNGADNDATDTGNDAAGAAGLSAYGNAQAIGLDPSWEFADYSVINSGTAVYYAAANNRNGITVSVNAGHGTKGGSSAKTYCHPDKTPKVTGGSTAKGAVTAAAVSGGMTFNDGTGEAVATLQLARIFRDKLLNAGYDVLMIRDGDDVQLDNVARTVISNNVADCHVALHWDGDSGSSDKGCFYASVPEQLKDMYPVLGNWQRCERLGQSLISGLRGQNLTIYNGGAMAIDLTQTSYSTIPSVDMELGNQCSDHGDAALNVIGDGLLAGINSYFQK